MADATIGWLIVGFLLFASIGVVWQKFERPSGSPPLARRDIAIRVALAVVAVAAIWAALSIPHAGRVVGPLVLVVLFGGVWLQDKLQH